MNHRERLDALLHYRPYDRLPIVHFGFWAETVQKWADEKHIPEDWAQGYISAGDFCDGCEYDMLIAEKLGFDYNYYTTYQQKSGLSSLFPAFAPEIVRVLPDGSRHELNADGQIVLVKAGTQGIPSEIGYMLKDRKAWEELYLPKLSWSPDRLDTKMLDRIVSESKQRETPLGIFCGSLYGQIRNWMGVEALSYLYADDEALYEEIIDTIGNLQYKVVQAILGSGAQFDFAHYWEDIAFKNGPLVIPSVFNEMVGPHYRKITDLLRNNGIDICSLDCDGVPDALIPTWLQNGVNTMFPIEVGTWGGSIAPWREKYGKELRGVGGMRKHVLAEDKKAVDTEIERLRPLVDLGGYLPCPDHRIALDAKWELVLYYTEKIRKVFG